MRCRDRNEETPIPGSALVTITASDNAWHGPNQCLLKTNDILECLEARRTSADPELESAGLALPSPSRRLCQIGSAGSPAGSRA